MSNIIWKMADGHIAVTTLVEAEGAKEHAQELLRRGDLPADWQAVAFDYPVDQFPTVIGMPAWAWDGSRVVADLAFAKTLTADRLRAEREPKLAALDVAYQRALEVGAATSDIVAEKNRLRDLPDQVNTCTTIEQLNALHA